MTIGIPCLFPRRSSRVLLIGELLAVDERHIDAAYSAVGNDRLQLLKEARQVLASKPPLEWSPADFLRFCGINLGSECKFTMEDLLSRSASLPLCREISQTAQAAEHLQRQLASAMTLIPSGILLLLFCRVIPCLV